MQAWRLWRYKPTIQTTKNPAPRRVFSVCKGLADKDWAHLTDIVLR